MKVPEADRSLFIDPIPSEEASLDDNDDELIDSDELPDGLETLEGVANKPTR